MDTLLTITWDFGKGLDLGFFTLRFYSLLFAAGFVLGYFIMKKIFEKDGVPIQKLDTLLTYIVLATIVGARLGHVFFYQWDYYSMHPGEILQVWKGGLASHGAAIALIVAVIIYCRRELKKPTLWMLDRLVITVAIAAALIRVGNWFNSEIYGAVDNSAMETVFTNPIRESILVNLGENIESIEFENTGRELVTDSITYPIYDMTFQLVNLDANQNKEQVDFLLNDQIKRFVNRFDKEDKNIIFPVESIATWDPDVANLAHFEVLGVPRHPTQLYEALGYLMIFLILFKLFQNASIAQRKGFVFGLFLILVFGFRFFIEFLKENQVSSEEGQSLNIGQYLSIPLVLIGAYFVATAKKYKNE